MRSLEIKPSGIPRVLPLFLSSTQRSQPFPRTVTLRLSLMVPIAPILPPSPTAGPQRDASSLQAGSMSLTGLSSTSGAVDRYRTKESISRRAILGRTSGMALAFKDPAVDVETKSRGGKANVKSGVKSEARYCELSPAPRTQLKFLVHCSSRVVYINSVTSATREQAEDRKDLPATLCIHDETITWRGAIH